TAKPPASYTHEQFQPLFRDLLADRFKLVVHHDSKEVSAFGLIVAKGGPKLREATKRRDYFTARAGLIACARASTTELASALARLLGRPVADNTGLTGAYDVRLEWTPDQPASVSVADDKSAEPGPSIFTALQEQLGLRLQRQKAVV